MQWKSDASRYGGVSVALHWVTAGAVLGLLALGFWAADTDDPAAKALLLRIHVPLGIFVLAVTILRIVWWLFDRRPAPVPGLPRPQAIAARVHHCLLYAFMIIMAASGIGMMVQTRAAAALFGGSGALPDFWSSAARVPHGIGGRVLLALVLIHVGAALHHQLIRRDRLLARMGIGSVS